MKLSNYELRVGVVHIDKDPEHLGRIKVIIPGVLDNSTIRDELLPWCFPFNMNHHNSFTKIIKGQKVMVLYNLGNEFELWYIPYYEYLNNVKEFLNQYDENDHPEVIYARENNANTVMECYDDQNGIRKMINDKGLVQLKPDGDIKIHGVDGRVAIRGSHVFCGQGDSRGDYECGVKGETLVNILNDLKDGIMTLKQSCSGGQDNPALKLGFQQCETALSHNNDILCKNVSVN